MFCVYSGDGVNQLRAFLRLNGPPDEDDNSGLHSESTIRGGQFQHTTPSQLPFSGPFHPSNAQQFPTFNTQHQQHHHHGQPIAFLPPPPPHHVMPPQLSSYSWLQHATAPLINPNPPYGQQQHQMGPPPPPPPPAHAQMPSQAQGAAQVPLALTGDDADVDDEVVDGDGDEDMRGGDD